MLSNLSVCLSWCTDHQHRGRLHCAGLCAAADDLCIWTKPTENSPISAEVQWSQTWPGKNGQADRLYQHSIVSQVKFGKKPGDNIIPWLPTSIVSQVKFGKKPGDNIIPWLPTGDEILSNKWLILVQLDVLKSTVPSKKISTASFLGHGLLTGSTANTGGWIVVK